MSEVTAIHALPLIQPAQAQKHVTHNEALRLLDVAVQLAVISRTETTPPAGPSEGDRYIVAPGATAAWVGVVGKIAVWTDGYWDFHDPHLGWRAFVMDTQTVATWDGVNWETPSPALVTAQMLGVNASADVTNRFALSSDTSLFNHEGAGHSVKINKATTNATASIILQDNWSGHAEIGLNGSNDLSFKVSLDGSSFATALAFENATGNASFSGGVLIDGLVSGLAVQQTATDTTAGRLMRADYGFGPGNLIGTVSESAGSPTGAVIENGSNANGKFVRFADGTQICTSPAIATGAITTALGAGFESGAATWTMPIGFAASTTPIVTGQCNAAQAWLGIDLASSTAVDFRAIALTSIGGGVHARLVAIGRWF